MLGLSRTCGDSLASEAATTGAEDRERMSVCFAIANNDANEVTCRNAVVVSPHARSEARRA